MGKYRVGVRFTGVLVMEADSEEEAAASIGEWPELHIGKAERHGDPEWVGKLLDKGIQAETLGEVEHHTLRPDKIITTIDFKIVPRKKG